MDARLKSGGSTASLPHRSHGLLKRECGIDRAQHQRPQPFEAARGIGCREPRLPGIGRPNCECVLDRRCKGKGTPARRHNLPGELKNAEVSLGLAAGLDSTAKAEPWCDLCTRVRCAGYQPQDQACGRKEPGTTSIKLSHA